MLRPFRTLNQQCWLLLLISVLLEVGLVGSIREAHLHFPSVVSIGEPVTLECRFKLEDESLYSVKLYRGNKEFLHFIPEFSPPYKVYPTRGISIKSVNMSLGSLMYQYPSSSTIINAKPSQIGSGSIVVELERVNLYTHGLYSCEISADSPSWDTRVVRRRLHVLVEPVKQPIIVGIEPAYKPGQDVNITCIAKDTYPSSNITWYTGGKKVPDQLSVGSAGPSGLITTTSTLNVPIYNNITVKCITSLWTHHYQSLSYSLVVRDPLMASVKTNNTFRGSDAISKAESVGAVVMVQFLCYFANSNILFLIKQIFL